MTRPIHRTRRRRTRPSTDHAFDELVPEELRHLSKIHWTPIDVAIRAATLLYPRAGMRILDVGAGVGKLCAVGALFSRATWCGVEQHGHLVATAERLVRALGVANRTMFVHGDAFSMAWEDYDAFYLYNPFEIPLFPRSSRAIDALESRVQAALVEERLARLPPKTRVVTLNGFGGAMPASYDLVYQEHIPGVGLDLVSWIQRPHGRHGSPS